ncbi:unnamed protein product, partial [Scytosiphon promiscuus]
CVTSLTQHNARRNFACFSGASRGAMSRAYRPRLSKDKAVAQRLQDLSSVRQVSDVLEIDDPLATPPSTGAAEAPSAVTMGTSLGAKSTPTSTGLPKGCGSSRHRSRSTKSAKATPKTTAGKAKLRASNCSSTTTPTAASSAATNNAAASSGHGSTSGEGGWSCVSCSFLNAETAKKCGMCLTKNYQPRPKTLMLSAAGSRGGTGVALNGKEGARSQRRRQSGGGPRERRSPRRPQQDDDAGAARPSIAGDARKAEPKERCAGAENEGAGVDHAGTGDISHSPRKRSRNSTLGRTATPRGPETGCAVLPLPLPEEESTPTRRSRRTGRSDAIVATPTPREGALGSVGARHPNRGKPIPPQSSSSSCHTRSKKRARFVPYVTPSGEAGPLSGSSPLAARSREGSASSSPQTASRGDQPSIPPCVVPALTADSDRELDADSEASGPKKTSRRRRREETGTVPEESEASPIAPASPVAAERAPHRPGGEHEWPTTAVQVSKLDFSGRLLLEVSSVVVTSAVSRGASGRPGAANASSASIVVCHAGGVSVWDLTDEEAVCTCLSPSLLSTAKEAVAMRFFSAAVVGGDPAEVSPSATRAPGPRDAYILAIGRQEADPGFPIFRDEGSTLRGADVCAGRGGGAAKREHGAASAATTIATPPAILTIALRKKFSKFFPPAVPGRIKPCLCVCDYSRPKAAAANAPDKIPASGHAGAVAGDRSPGAGSGVAGEITAVMALGGKALRLVFRAGKNVPQEFRAKALPTGAAEVDAVFTSLAPVPSNPLLVCASLPSINAILVWSVGDTDLLFTLPLTALSICVPPIGPAGGAAGSNEALPGLDEELAARKAPATKRPDTRLLCLMATGGRDHGGVVSGRKTTSVGCGLFGICCSEGGVGGARDARVSAVRLEVAVDADEETSSAPQAGENERGRDGVEADRYFKERSGGGGGGDRACLRSLSIGGGGFVVGVDGQGRIGARSLITGEPRVFFTPDAATAATDGAGGAEIFAAIDCDPGSGIVALA